MPSIRYGRLALAIAVSTLMLAACTKKAEESTTATATTTTKTSATTSGAPAADNVATADGTTFASFTGNAVNGEAVFMQCRACHDLVQNRIGPPLHGVVGHKVGAVPGFPYSDAAKNSGIVWTPEKLFQYLEKPQRVIPGTRMTFAGISDPQKRADVIAYLKAN